MKKLFLTLIVGAASLFAQTIPNAVPAPTPEIQWLDQNGHPLAGAFLCTFAAGTTTPQDTYTDSSAGTRNANPIVLDSAGRAQVWIGPNAYKFVLYVGGTQACPSTGAVQWTEDNLVDTTLNFVNFVKNAGTCTLITYNPPNGQAQTTCSAELTALTSNPYVNLKLNCGAKGDGTTNDYAAITSCLANNNIVYAPPGTYCTQSAIVVPNKTQMRGSGRGDSGGPNTVFKACSGFPTSTPVISLCSTPGPCSGVQVENLTIDCNGISGCIGGQNSFSQEQSWFRHVLVASAPGDSFLVSTSAAQNSGPYEDLEALSLAVGTTTSTCFHALAVPAWRGLSGLTCNPDGYALIPAKGVLLEDIAPGRVADIHTEHVQNGVVLGSSGHAAQDIVVMNIESGAETVNAVVIAALGSGGGKQNITLIGVSSTAGNVLADQCNSVTLAAATAGLGYYATGYGTCGAQTIYTTRQDLGVHLQTTLDVLKNLTVAGTGTVSDDGKICVGPGTPYCFYAHESATSGVPGAVIKTGDIGLLVQGASATRGAPGGGLALNGNCAANDAAQGQVSSGVTSDCATFTARATTAAIMLFNDGGIKFYSDTGLTPGVAFTPTLRFQWMTTGHFQVESGGTYSFNGNNGFTGNKVAGACTLTIQAGIITNVAGC